MQITSLITPIEAAAILGVKPETLAIWRSNKRYDLPYVKSGRLVKYRLEDIQSFIDSRLVGVEVGNVVH